LESQTARAHLDAAISGEIEWWSAGLRRLRPGDSG